MSKFLFSGIASLTELQLLETAFAGSDKPGILLGRHDYHSLFIKYTKGKPKAKWAGSISLDSDAFRNRDSKINLSSPTALNAYVRMANSHPFHFVSTVDVFGDPAQTRANWDNCKHLYPFVPIWNWGSDRALLDYYAEESARYSSGLIGIGGLVPAFRDEHLRDSVIAELVELAQAYPGRFHLFGACRVQVINQLAPYVPSFDSSLWLRAGRKRGNLIFVHSRTGKLHEAPATELDNYFGCANWSGDQLAIANAQNIHNYLKEHS